MIGHDMFAAAQGKHIVMNSPKIKALLDLIFVTKRVLAMSTQVSTTAIKDLYSDEVEGKSVLSRITSGIKKKCGDSIHLVSSAKVISLFNPD